MKKLFLFLLTLIYFQSFGQKNYDYLNDYLKELVVIQSLITENRITDLSNFLDEHSYISLKENTFSKFEIGSEKLGVNFSINTNSKNKRFLVVNLMYQDFEKNNFTVNDVQILRYNLMRQTKATSKETFKLIWSFFKDTKKGIEDKTVQGVAKDSSYYDNFKIIDRYSYKERLRENNDNYFWQTVKASNWTDMLGGEKFSVHSFVGPGKMPFINIVFFKLNKFESSKEVPTTFTIRTSQFNSDDDKNKAPFNVDFFMSLKNWDDVIWSDNN